MRSRAWTSCGRCASWTWIFPPSERSCTGSFRFPQSPQAAPVVAALTAHYAHILGRPDDARLQRQLLARLEAVNDPRRERYLTLLAVINGWSALESLTPVLDWSIQALGARILG
jgi:hypothetical protein